MVCCACVIGRLEEERLWLEKASVSGAAKKLKFMAPNDSDLDDEDR
jgi:hypothetical protein